MIRDMKNTTRILGALLALLVLATNPAGSRTMASSPLPLMKAELKGVRIGEPALRSLADLAAAQLNLPATMTTGAVLEMELDREPANTGAYAPSREILEPGLTPEDYRLEIRPDGLRLTATGGAGLFRGVQTLRQLLAAPGAALPCGVIEDAPAFRWRGMLLDCGRHFMPLDLIKETIDQLAYHKFNVLHWHLTEDQGWRVEVPGYPRLTEVGAWRTQPDGSVYGGFYTTEEMREIVAYAAERFITVVPEIELPGHSQAALAAYPRLGCLGAPLAVQNQWGVFEDVYCAGNDEVFTFLEDVFTHVLSIFPSRYIHIGGDECPKDRWRQCEKCQARIKAQGLDGEHQLQSWFIRRMEAWLLAHDRRLVGWDEILEGGLAPQATVQSWRGTRGAIAAARQGHDTVVSPTSHCYFDYDAAQTDMRQVYTFDPVPDKLDTAQAHHVLGGEMNLWSEYIPPERLQNMVFPRMTAMAECLWTRPPTRDFGAFLERWRPHMAVLAEMGVQPGPADRPVEFTVALDPEDGATRLTLDVKKDLREALTGHELEIRLAQVAGEPPAGYGPDLRVEDMGLPAVQERDAQAWPLGGRLDWKTTDGESRILAAQLFIDGTPYGTPAVLERTGHLALGRIPVLAHQPSARYPGGGPAGLVNGARGTREFRDGLWLGFESTDLDARIDLGAARPINEMSIRCYQGSPAWIFLPSEVEFQISDDGRRWETVAIVSHDVSPRIQDRLVHEFRAEGLERRARHVRVIGRSLGVCPDWHYGAGGPCWIFVDEIVVR